MAKDRRRAERLESHLFADIETSYGERLGRGVVVNVSATGFAVETDAALPMDGTVTCHIEIPITLNASVVRTIGSGLVRKYGLKVEAQSFFDKFVFRRLLRGNRRSRKIGR